MLSVPLCSALALVAGTLSLCGDLMLWVCAVQDFPWIAEQKQFFGQPSSDYDFAAADVDKMFEDYEKGDEMVKRLQNKVNRKVCAHSA